MKRLAFDSLEEITSLADLPNGECTFCCPFCPPSKHDGKRKLSVNFTKNLYHCWRCGASGRASELLHQYSNIDNKELNNYAFKDFDKTTKLRFHNSNSKARETSDIKTEIFAYDNITLKILENALPNAHAYLNNRGITDEEIKYYDIRVGLYAYKDRILIPTFDDYGNVTYFVARDYVGKSPMKYFNAKDTNKSEHVWNLDKVKENDIVIITEGCFSGISANRVPGMTAVCTFGKAFSDEQVRAIVKHKPKEIILSLDGDVSERETEKSLKLIRRYFNGLLTVAHLPADKDPNDMTLEEYQKVINERSVYKSIPPFIKHINY